MSVVHPRIDDDTFKQMLAAIVILTDYIEQMNSWTHTSMTATTDLELTHNMKVKNWREESKVCEKKFNYFLKLKYGTLRDYTITHQFSKLSQIFDTWNTDLKTAVSQVNFKKAYQSYCEIYEKYPKDLNHLFLWYLPDERKPVVPQPSRAAPRGQLPTSRHTGMGEAQEKPKRKRRNRKKKNKNDQSEDPKSKNQSAGLQDRELEDLLKKQRTSNNSAKKKNEP